MGNILLTQTDHGRSIEVRVGDRVVIDLSENPSTGFQWAIEQNNDRVLKPLSSTYTPPTGTTVGGAGQRTFAFLGQASGIAEPRFKLWREWEGNASIVERFSVTIQVRD
ncbi:MAG TPA: protease inhibitor I42 family protein [Leptolyngbyaceae cyanobacterium M65_K2018_010]|nr:protease inhibitor I42 family protein [Leptolyngbyaceae cyanobacterium M65_K2018_010]